MPAAALPKKLHARLDHLAGRVRKARLLRAVARTAFLLPAGALVCILADAYLTLPTILRAGLLLGWIGLALRQTWRLVQAWRAPVDLEAVASAVDVEFPRLAERLTTAVELAGRSDVSNGSPALINEVIKDADTRARKLDLATAFPTSGATAAAVTALLALLFLLIPAVTAPRGGELLRRFFLPGYVPKQILPYEIEVTSADPAIKRGGPVTLAAVIKPTREDAVLPTAATLVMTVHGKDERVAMQSDQPNVWHVRRPVVDADFAYRVEAGGAVSETRHVTVVEPVTLASARVTVTPPAYASLAHELTPVEGLGELAALEHSTVTFDLRFSPQPTAVNLEFIPDRGGEAARSARERYRLQVADDGSTRFTIPARHNGRFVLTADGDRGVRSEFPPQPLRVHTDEPPQLPRVNGLADKPRQARPTEQVVVEATATDDVALTRLVLEWKVDDGPVQTVPLQGAMFPAPQVEGKAVLSLAGLARPGQKLYCRLAATDNRDLPAERLSPQTAYFPARDWAEFEIDPAAEPLDVQEITRRQAEIDARLKEVRRDLVREGQAAGQLDRDTRTRRALDSDEEDRLRKVREDIANTADKLNDLARDVGVTAELSRLADGMTGIADRELRESESALDRARSESREGRPAQFKKAGESLDAAVRKVDELIRENDRIARERLDRRRLNELAREQQELADKARTADPAAAADLARRQKELADELSRLREESEAIKRATAAAQADEARKLADEARVLADEMRDLNDAINKVEADSSQKRLADLRKSQEELARKSQDLADQTDDASRIAQVSPLKPDDAAAAAKAMERGDLDEAAKQQAKARQELDRLARDLERAAADARDPREAARQLARLQEHLRNRLAQETKTRPLDQLPAEQRTALERQQEAIAHAAARLRVPDGDLPAATARLQAAADASDARDLLKKGAENGAERKMQEARQSLENLAERLPTREQRRAKARQELADLKQQQDELRKKAEAATRTTERKDPDAPATQHELAGLLEESARKQAALADRLAGLDAPGQASRVRRAADAMQQAATDLTAGRPQDIAASQTAARRELDRLEQALNNQTPADEKVQELTRQQQQIAAEAARNAANPDRGTQQELQRRQGEIARELDKVQTPEAATAQAEAAAAARQAEVAGHDINRPDELARKSREAAEKLDQLNQRVNGSEPPAMAADRLARSQRENADAQAKRPDPASTREARTRAAQELDELKNLRAGPDAQNARQRAQDALQRAANAFDPANNTKAQQDAADALKELAETLTRSRPAEAGLPPTDPADAADRLAKKQKDLVDQLSRQLDEARQMPGEAGQQAGRAATEQAAREQRALARQAGELPGQDAPAERQRAEAAMRRAADELDRNNPESAGRRAREAVDSLDQLARKARERQDDQARDGELDVPRQSQADAARALAEEQRKLQEQVRQASEQMARENAPRPDNPVGELAREQQELARQAEELARNTADRQGPTSDLARQSRQAAEATRRAAQQAAQAELSDARESGRQAAEALEQMARDRAGESGERARDLARRQADLNQKLDTLSRDPGAAKAQQAARQQQLERQSRELGDRLEGMSKAAGGMEETPSPAGQSARSAADSARQAADRTQTARQASQRGQRDQAGTARGQAAEAMARAADQAGNASRQFAGSEPSQAGSPQAGQALNQARDQMGQAGQRLGQGQPSEAGRAMDQAARSLQQAAGQLGSRTGDSRPGQGTTGTVSGGNLGGPGGQLDLRSFDPEIAQHSGKAWGELPGEIRTRIIQQMRARYGEDYARNIKLYFEQLAERK